MLPPRSRSHWTHPVPLEDHYWEMRKQASLEKEAVDWTSLQMMASQAQPVLQQAGTLASDAWAGLQHGYHAATPVMSKIPMLEMVPHVSHAVAPHVEAMVGNLSAGKILPAAGNYLGMAGSGALALALPKLTIMGALGSSLHPDGKTSLSAKLFKPYSMDYLRSLRGAPLWRKALEIPRVITGGAGNIIQTAGQIHAKNGLAMLNAGLAHGLDGTVGKRRWLANNIRRPLNIGGDYLYEAGLSAGKKLRDNNIYSIKELRPEHYQQALQHASEQLRTRGGLVGAVADHLSIKPGLTEGLGSVLKEVGTDDAFNRMARVATRPEGQSVWQAYRNSPFTSGTQTRITSPLATQTARNIAAPMPAAVTALPFRQRLGIARRAIFSPGAGAANIGTRLGRSLRLLTKI